MPTCVIACATLVAGPPRAAGGDREPELRERTNLEIDFPRALAWADRTQPAEPPVGRAPSAAPSFGDKNSWRWYISGGYGVEFEATHDQFVIIGGGVSFFMIDDLSLNLELNGLYFDQETASGYADSHDAWGINFAMLLRWHFLAAERWSLYVDGGAGFLGTTQRVPGPDADDPDGGTYFNFTPQLGVGASFAVGESARVLTGVRWYHISNARSSADNPGRDSLEIYAGVSFPF